jgi:spore cortex biosynthesis protein YabQ
MGTMILSGLALGVFYDIYRVVARLLRAVRKLQPIFDIAYWIAAALLVFRVLYISNFGQLRMFVFLALLLGISIYYALLSGWVIRIIYGVIRAGKAVIRFCVRLFHAVIVRPILLLYRVVKVLLGFLLALSIFLGKFVLQLLYPLWFLLKLLFRPMIKRWKTPLWALAAIGWLKRWLKRIFDWF